MAAAVGHSEAGHVGLGAFMVSKVGQGDVVGGVGDNVLPGLLECTGRGVTRVVLQVEEHRGGVVSNGGSWGDEVASSFPDGFVEDGEQVRGFVASGEQVVEHLEGSGLPISSIGAEGVDPVDVAKDKAEQDTWWVGGVGRQIQVQVEGFLIEGGVYSAVGSNGEGEV